MALALLAVAPGPVRAADAVVSGRSEQLLREQQHFVQCLVFIYSPELWISYTNALFFSPRNDDQRRQIEALKTATAR